MWNGSVWSAFGTIGVKNGVNNSVRAIAVSGTNVYVGGDFTTVSSSTQNGVSVNRVAMWNGSVWSAFGRRPNGIIGDDGLVPSVNVIAVSGTNVYVGGAFRIVLSPTQNNVAVNNIATWNGILWSSFGQIESYSQNGVNNICLNIALSGSNIYVGGLFTRVASLSQGSITANRIAVWDGLEWSRVGDPSKLENGTNDAVNNVELDNYNNVYIGGYFTKVTDSTQTIPANNLAIWNGSKWNSLKSGSVNGPNKRVNIIKTSTTNIYVGGVFDQVTDSTQNISSNNIFFL